MNIIIPIVIIIFISMIIIYIAYQRFITKTDFTVLNRSIIHPDGLFSFKYLDRYKTYPYQASSSRAKTPLNGKRYFIKSRYNNKYISRLNVSRSRNRASRFIFDSGKLRLRNRFIGVHSNNPMGKLKMVRERDLSSWFEYDMDSGMLLYGDRYLTINSKGKLDLTYKPNERSQWDFI